MATAWISFRYLSSYNSCPHWSVRTCIKIFLSSSVHCCKHKFHKAFRYWNISIYFCIPLARTRSASCPATGFVYLYPGHAVLHVHQRVLYTSSPDTHCFMSSDGFCIPLSRTRSASCPATGFVYLYPGHAVLHVQQRVLYTSSPDTQYFMSSNGFCIPLARTRSASCFLRLSHASHEAGPFYSLVNIWRSGDRASW